MAKSPENARPPANRIEPADGLALSAGLLIGLGLLKFGNPVIFDGRIIVPQNLSDILDTAWPITWGYGLLGTITLAAWFVGKPKAGNPKWILFLPLIWLAWQGLAATQTVSGRLTAAVLPHFIGCAACFYVGWYALSETRRPWLFWLGVLPGLILVFRIGLAQHFGGLEATRRHFEMYVLPTLKDPPPDLIKKMATTRIFSTLFYPNTLAGVIILLLPATLLTLNRVSSRLQPVSRSIIIGIIASAGLACLYWSGSKSGWLIVLIMLIMWFLHAPTSRRVKFGLIAGILGLGITGFFLKYESFFARGATSVGARFDYWRAATTTALRHPVLGTGPGTFSIPYSDLKSPDAEMARLCHNDYLEQATDSGIPGFAAYSAMFVGFLILLYRNSKKSINSLSFAIWLGLLGISIQGLTEFNLYIPALAWPTFLLFGWLWGEQDQANSID